MSIPARPRVATTILFGAMVLTSCAATVASSDVNHFDTTRCYWAPKHDAHGDYEQMYCWNPHYAAFRRIRSNGVLVRRWSDSYSGPRPVVVVPQVTIIPRPPPTERSAQPEPEPEDETPSAEDLHGHTRSL